PRASVPWLMAMDVGVLLGITMACAMPSALGTPSTSKSALALARLRSTCSAVGNEVEKTTRDPISERRIAAVSTPSTIPKSGRAKILIDQRPPLEDLTHSDPEAGPHSEAGKWI